MSGDIKSVLITGAGGFIGGHTVEYFARHGWRVFALTHRHVPERLRELAARHEVIILTGDVTDQAAMEAVMRQCMPGLSAIVHCAGHASDVGSRRLFRKLNYDSVCILGELSARHNIARLVHVSTTDVYGLHDFCGQSETELTFDERAGNYYPKFKIMAEKWLVANLPAERYSIIRPAAVCGPDDPTITPRIVSFLRHSPFIIHFGKWRGQNRWPITDVTLVAKACYLAATLPQAAGRAINVLNSEQVTADEFYRRIAGEYYPGRDFRSITLPLWLGLTFGWLVSAISNLLGLHHAFTDPSLYAVQTVSANLDFSVKLLNDFITIPVVNEKVP